MSSLRLPFSAAHCMLIAIMMRFLPCISTCLACNTRQHTACKCWMTLLIKYEHMQMRYKSQSLMCTSC